MNTKLKMNRKFALKLKKPQGLIRFVQHTPTKIEIAVESCTDRAGRDKLRKWHGLRISRNFDRGGVL